MIRQIFGPETVVGILRTGLNESSEAHRNIQSKVANALSSDQNADFAATLNAQLANAQDGEQDLLGDMIALADNQLRYDAEASLLRRTYEQIRTAIHERS